MLTQGALSIDAQPWPAGLDAPEVVAARVQVLGLRPEDTYGVLPAGDELVFVYRDREEYRGDATVPTADAEAIMDMFGLDAWGQPSGAATLFVHRVEWPATADAFERYRAAVGVRSSDMYGFFRNSTFAGRDGDGDSDGDGACCIAYRDRPEYAAAREELDWDVLPPLSFPGVVPDAVAATDTTGGMSLDESPWPRSGLRDYVAQMIASQGLAPEDCYGLGVNASSTKLWLASRA